MKIYLDSLDSFYAINHDHESKLKQKPKPKKDYAGIAAVIFTFTVTSIVIGLSIYTAYQIAYGQPVEFKTYTNNDMKFSIQHPSNWQVLEDEKSPHEIVWLQDSNGTKFIVQIKKVVPYLDTDSMTLKNTSLQQYA